MESLASRVILQYTAMWNGKIPQSQNVMAERLPPKIASDR